MYVGLTDARGLFQLAAEPISNAVDLFLAGSATEVRSLIHDDGSFEVVDDGPGINLADPRVLDWFEEFHDSPTADGHRPHIHVGHLGLGLALVNYLSARMVVHTQYNGESLCVEWRDGARERRQLDTRREPELALGTSVRFWPDSSVFGAAVFPEETIAQRMNEVAAFIPGLTLSVYGRSWRFDDWQQGLASIAGASGPSAGAERLSWADDGTKITTRVLVCRPADPELIQTQVVQWRSAARSVSMVPVKVYANCRPMDDHGEFLLRLADQTQSTNALLGENFAAVSHVVMAGPKITGPTRARLDDARALTALDRLLTEDWDQLIEELRL